MADSDSHCGATLAWADMTLSDSDFLIYDQYDVIVSLVKNARNEFRLRIS